jgi:ubiquinone/menaquinone biosynthesis C-methylase UbiE
MTESEDIAERFWSLPQKPDEEARREELFLDDVIHKAHVQREIESRLDGIETAIDVGAGTGRFSLWLASRGVRVTHLDISPGMIDRARRDAVDAGLVQKLTFRHGRLADLGTYAAGGFDLVICSDAPLSYAYPDQATALTSLVRICAKAIVLSVSSRPAYASLVLNPAQKEPYFADPDSDDPLVRFYRRSARARLADREPGLEAARKALRTGLTTSPEETLREYQAGRAPWPHNYLFRPAELHALLAASGVTDIRLSGPGALSRGLSNDLLRKLLLNKQHRDDFLELCYEFDSEPSVCGMGKDNLVASGRVVRG